MATIYRALVTSLLLFSGYVLFTGTALRSDPDGLGWHLRVGLVGTVLGMAVHCIAFAYFIGTSYWVKTFVQASDAGDDWVVRQREWIKGRAFPVLYAAALLPAAAAVAGNLVDTGRLGSAWHPVLVVMAVAAHGLALWWVPDAMRRNAALMDELVAAHHVPTPGTPEAQAREEAEARNALPPLFQLSRVLLYGSANVLIVWLYLRFGTETFRDVSSWPFLAGFGGLLAMGLCLNALHDPEQAVPPARAWIRALAWSAGSCAALGWAMSLAS